MLSANAHAPNSTTSATAETRVAQAAQRVLAADSTATYVASRVVREMAESSNVRSALVEHHVAEAAAALIVRGSDASEHVLFAMRDAAGAHCSAPNEQTRTARLVLPDTKQVTPMIAINTQAARLLPVA